MNADLVKGLQTTGRITSPQVAAAFTAVPRHLFVPGVPLEDAYRDDAVFTKRDTDGKPVSSVSAPWLVATMLERLRARPGDRVLEVGSGGYNAALLRQLVGDGGRVTSQDIDPEVIDRAARCLEAAGCTDIRLVTNDGHFGVPDGAPYDRIVVTAQATTIAPAWLEQLTDEGRLVVPLRLRGLGRLLTFTQESGHWRGDGWDLCGFVRMRGQAAKDPVATTLLGDDVRLRWDGGAQPDAAALTEALAGKRHEVWTGVTVGVTEGTRPVVDVWLATVLDVFGRLHVDRQTLDRPGGAWTLPGGSPVTWSANTLAYLTMRPVGTDNARFEYGVAWHGRDETLAEDCARHLRVWDHDHRGGPGPALHLHPEGSECLPAAGRVLDGPGLRMVLAWP
ncbi:methyltransferase, FxLD system [Streptomyces sp. 110]|uniref:Protein-L-isoaspartate O-methyltransferase n=1 Tax=Streptomyces endocoffeicus TaxID=2898945 RepID=A0ABS1Q3E8_9ACTN|nr:methyltransferase, FxLD system [Streptomyces endocoffeicus]MBL1119191.1 methyltransferase, FxLD system [Streptomyces endocoffeicus]